MTLETTQRWGTLTEFVDSKLLMIESALCGERNNTLNGCVYAIARVSHYELDYSEIYEATVEACGAYYDENPREIDTTFNSAWNAGVENPRTLGDDMTPTEFQTALQWCAYVSDHHPEIYDYFLETHNLTDTMYEITQKPLKLKGKKVVFPGDAKTPQGRARLIKTTSHYHNYQTELPYVLNGVRKATTSSVKFFRRKTTANFANFVNTITARMAIEGKSSVIFADDSINELMKEAGLPTLNYRTLNKTFKKELANLPGWTVTPGVKNHHDKATVYEVDLSPLQPPYGVGIHPYTSPTEVDTWLEPYEQAYYALQDHESRRSVDNARFRREGMKVVREAEEILREEVNRQINENTYVDEHGNHRVSFGSVPEIEESEFQVSYNPFVKRDEVQGYVRDVFSNFKTFIVDKVEYLDREKLEKRILYMKRE